MSAKAVYVVSAYTSYGLLVYLSVMGYSVGLNYNYVWEPGFVNARMFETKAEAERHADMAVGNLMGSGAYMIHKYVTKRDGKVQVTLVS